jgi:hypothetical protein
MFLSLARVNRPMQTCNLYRHPQSCLQWHRHSCLCSDDHRREPQPETAIGSLQLRYPATPPYATAISAATRALFNSNATFAPSVLPPLPFDNASNK